MGYLEELVWKMKSGGEKSGTKIQKLKHITRIKQQRLCKKVIIEGEVGECKRKK